MSEQPNPFSRPDLHLFGVKEAARILGTHADTVKAMVEAGVLPCVRVGETGEPRFALCLLEAWLVSTGTVSQTTSQRPVPVRPPAAPSRPLRRLEGSRK